MRDPVDNGGVGPTFGFLTTVDSPTHGLFGGYLVVDATGRPLEFHCTTPVKVSRAQQILYGATLPGHLHGRQIGASLLAEASMPPVAVLTDSESLLHVRAHTPLPVGLVGLPGAAASQPTIDDAHVSLGGVTVCLPPGAGEAIIGQLEELAGAVDLNEPFARIRAAIEEAQRH